MNKPRILYIQDAMCGWCYAFGGGLEELTHKFNDFFDFIAIGGGMVVDDNIGPIANLQSFLEKAIPEVENYTGVKFGEKYIDLVKEGTYINNSIKPAIALCAFKSFLPFRSVEFAHDLQFEHFYNGANLNEREVYLKLAENYGIDKDELINRMNDEKCRELATKEFEFVKGLGITGFPCVLGETSKGLYGLTHGYVAGDQLEKILEEFKKLIENGEPEPEQKEN